MSISIFGRAAIAAATLAGGGGTAAAIATGSSAPAPSPAVLASTSSPAGASRPAPASCTDPDAHWPAYVQGMPDGFDARDDGVYLWHNPAGGWGLRVSHPVLPGHADRVVFAGRIRTAGQIGDVTRVRDEKDDMVKVLDGGHVLAFKFVNYGGVDGVDFTVGCTPGIAAAFRADGGAVQTTFVHLGDKDAHPSTDPFRVRRRQSDTTTAPVKTKAPKAAATPPAPAAATPPAPAA